MSTSVLILMTERPLRWCSVGDLMKSVEIYGVDALTRSSDDSMLTIYTVNPAIQILQKKMFVKPSDSDGYAE